MHTFKLLEHIFPQDIVKYVLMDYITISKQQVKNNLVSVHKEMRVFQTFDKILEHDHYNVYNILHRKYPIVVLGYINDYKYFNISEHNKLMKDLKNVLNDIASTPIHQWHTNDLEFKKYSKIKEDLDQKVKYIPKLKKFMDAFYQKEKVKLEKRNSYLR